MESIAEKIKKSILEYTDMLVELDAGKEYGLEIDIQDKWMELYFGKLTVYEGHGIDPDETELKDEDVLIKTIIPEDIPAAVFHRLSDDFAESCEKIIEERDKLLTEIQKASERIEQMQESARDIQKNLDNFDPMAILEEVLEER